MPRKTKKTRKPREPKKEKKKSGAGKLPGAITPEPLKEKKSG